MSSKKETPAFPSLRPNSCGPKTPGEGGMSLRDWFAGQALPGAIALLTAVESTGKSPKEISEMISAACYGVADAMLAAREGRGS